jgi:phosphohistidine phosphatase
MKQLLVLRHAKSSWADGRLSDFERPLNKRGEYDAPRIGRILAQEDLVPQRIISSAARRAMLTAEAVAQSSGYEGAITATRDLYMAMPEEYVEVLNTVPDDCDLVMVVGHNPGIEDLVEGFTGSWERMPTAALAHVELPVDSWRSLEADTTGKLLNLWIPKELP